MTPDWFAARKGLITASRAANIIAGEEGMPAFKSPIEEYHALRAELGLEEPREEPEIDDFRKAALQWGLDSEPLHAAALGAHLGRTLVPFNAVVADDEYPWLAATPDYRIVEDDELAELKAPSGWGVAKWRGAVPFGPQVQAAVQMRVTGKKACTVSAYYQDEAYGPYSPHPTRFERKEREEHFVIGLLEAFWESVQSGVPPTPKASDYEAVRAFSKPVEGKRCSLPVSIMEEWLMIEARKGDMGPEMERLENDEKVLKAKIVMLMDDAGIGVFPDGTGFTLKSDERPRMIQSGEKFLTKPILRYTKKAWQK